MYLEGPLFNEIKSFYITVKQKGISWSEYVEHKRYLKTKIDDTVKEYLNLNDILLLQKKITKEQYCNMRSKLENTRCYYKKLVSYC